MKTLGLLLLTVAACIASSYSGAQEVGEARGILIVNGQSTELHHATAYRAFDRRSEEDKIVVVLSDQPIPDHALIDPYRSRKKEAFIRFVADSGANGLWIYFDDELRPKIYDLHHSALTVRAEGPIEDLSQPYLHGQARVAIGSNFHAHTTARLYQGLLSGDTADQDRSGDDNWQFVVRFNAALIDHTTLVERAAMSLAAALEMGTAKPDALAANGETIMLDHALAVIEQPSSPDSTPRTAVILSPDPVEVVTLLASGLKPGSLSELTAAPQLWLYLTAERGSDHHKFVFSHPPPDSFGVSGSTDASAVAVNPANGIAQGWVRGDDEDFGNTVDFALTFKAPVHSLSDLIRQTVDRRTQELSPGEAFGNLTIDGQNVNLRHTSAYQKTDGDLEVLLTAEPQLDFEETRRSLMFNDQAGVVVIFSQATVDTPYSSRFSDIHRQVSLQVAHPAAINGSWSESGSSTHGLLVPAKDGKLEGVVSNEGEFTGKSWQLNAAFIIDLD